MDGTIRELKNGQVLFRQGDTGTEMYTVRSGKVRIFRDHEGQETTLALLGPGEIFGEMAMFDDKPRSASAQAVGDTEVTVVDAVTFHRMTADPLLAGLLRKMSQRIRETDEQFEQLALADQSRRAYLSNLSVRREYFV